MRTSGKGEPTTAVYRNERCQWQGTSKDDCAQAVEHVAVRGKWPIPFDGSVSVCVRHAPAYRRAALKAGALA